MTDQPVLYEVRDAAALVTLNRPERLNAWSPDLEVAYAEALDRAAADPDVRAVVVTGAGRGFCAGADMSLLQGLAQGGPRSSGAARRRHMDFEPAVPKPVIAAVNGACAGLGLVHAMYCDVRFAAAGAKFATSFARRGLVAEHGLGWVLPRVVGLARAADLLLSGRTFLAEEAAAMGLVDRVLPAAELVDAALAYAGELATWSSPSSMQVIKRQLWQDTWGTLDEAVIAADKEMYASFERSDLAEGVASYVERRPPHFAGLAVPPFTEAPGGPAT